MDIAKSETPVIYVDEKTVTTAGTAIPLPAKKVKSCTVVGKSGNTGQIYVGGSDVNSPTNDGLDAGVGVGLVADNWLDLADIYAIKA